MTHEEIIAQLRELIDDRMSFITGDKEHDEVYIRDVQALENALLAVENYARLERQFNRVCAMLKDGDRK